MKVLKSLITKTMETALMNEDLNFPILVSVLLVENEEILRINREFRDKDSVTDVLSFPMLDMKDGRFLKEPGTQDFDNGKLFLGDIVISVPRAIEQAEEYGHGSHREIAFLAAHGLLHLLGYDHEKPEDENIMKNRQNRILTDMGLERNSF